METAFKSDEMISFHRNKYDIEPNPPDSLQLAYEDKRYEKMTSEILEAADVLKIKTLQELNADFVWADKIAFALRLSGILHALIRHLPNPVDEIRELSSRALINCCDVMKGKQLIRDNEYILSIVALVDDPLDKIRGNALDCLKNYTQFTDEADECVRKDVLKKLVQKLIEEKNVDNLHKCLQVIRQLLEAEDGIFKILLTPAITRLKHLLTHDVAKIRSAAAYDLSSISFKNEGKEMIVKEGCVVCLCELMTDSDQMVVENATVALVSLAQLKSAKVEIIKSGHQVTATTLLENPAVEIRLNAVQLIGGVSEEPSGRKYYLGWVEKLRDMLKDPENESIKEYIQNTLDTILWKP